MVFDGFPVWLWSVRLGDWSTIYLSHEDERQLKEDHPQTWEFAKAKLTPVSYGTLKEIGEVSLWVVSGPMTTRERIDSFIGAKVFWLSSAVRRKPRTYENSG